MKVDVHVILLVVTVIRSVGFYLMFSTEREEVRASTRAWFDNTYGYISMRKLLIILKVNVLKNHILKLYRS